ncbi:MAG: hypothetical protein GDA50_08705 [Alphaproteobacteria bacterium GM202ARS2]|nr:hypothetical protein [Alphaproteobacteria bacterium GM202ARS2]
MTSFKLDQAIFLMAFERDVDYQNDPPEEVYLDLVTGNLAWIYDEDDDAETLSFDPWSLPRRASRHPQSLSPIELDRG